jgi:hypothetical protein
MVWAAARNTRSFLDEPAEEARDGLTRCRSGELSEKETAMFVAFFHEFKSAGVPVTLREYLTLMEAHR